MAVEFTDLLNPNFTMAVGGKAASPSLLEKQQQMTRKIAVHLLCTKQSGNKLMALFTRAKSSILMQQTFENDDILCAFIDEAGDVTYFDHQGHRTFDGRMSHLNPAVSTAWSRPEMAGPEKIGLVVAAPAFAGFLENLHNNCKDARFAPALDSLAEMLGPVMA